MTHDILETMRAELDEGIADKDDDALREYATYWRPRRYEKGRWPSAEEIEEDKAKFQSAECTHNATECVTALNSAAPNKDQ